MAAILDCPQCERKLRVPDELQGTRVQCPTCGVIFAAPVASAQPASLPLPDPEPEPSAGAFLEEPAPREEISEILGERRAGEYEQTPIRPPRSGVYLRPHRGTLILVLGILSLVFCPLGFLGPVAWILGSQDLREIRAGRMDPQGEGITNGGRICGMIGTFVNLVVPFCCGMPTILMYAFRAAAAHHGL